MLKNTYTFLQATDKTCQALHKLLFVLYKEH